MNVNNELRSSELNTKVTEVCSSELNTEMWQLNTEVSL
jgi:hypothetical protein